MVALLCFALLEGLISILAKKGKNIHKTSGLIFSIQ
ncbi:hypothetical protein PI23P_08210 [Polaribacter irgensii 23-P]|uniref:Uncharacterized protein n=1 Tax=Polaribacter irgensii 23-P TaxID=313594 RepID=A4BZK1_9FLAO|nr:hypothetical protein PI23P_08210 [Polaribacter irgensii 23-P]